MDNFIKAKIIGFVAQKVVKEQARIRLGYLPLDNQYDIVDKVMGKFPEITNRDCIYSTIAEVEELLRKDF